MKEDRKTVEDCYRAGRPIPKKLQNAPVLRPGLSIFFSAFNDLTTCRSLGFGVGPIPWTAINTYAETLDLRGFDRLDFIYLVRSMDSAYLDFMSKESEKAKKGSGTIGGQQPS